MTARTEHLSSILLQRDVLTERLAEIRALCDSATTVHAKLVLRDRIRDLLDGEG